MSICVGASGSALSQPSQVSPRVAFSCMSISANGSFCQRTASSISRWGWKEMPKKYARTNVISSMRGP
eukprot:7304602-Alexandrium_andersonii.AAC.1